MKITSVEKNKRNKKMFLVNIDEEYEFSISEEDYLRLGLYEKKEITKEEISYIKTDLNVKEIKSKAVQYLSLRVLSEKELFEKLKNKGYDENIIEKVILDLKSMGYINDMIFAQKFVLERLKLKPKSKKMLKMELKIKGISEDIAETVINNLDYDEGVSIESLIKKKYGKYNLDDPKVIRKAYSFLMQRGFDIESIKDAFKSI